MHEDLDLPATGITAEKARLAYDIDRLLGDLLPPELRAEKEALNRDIIDVEKSGGVVSAHPELVARIKAFFANEECVSVLEIIFNGIDEEVPQSKPAGPLDRGLKL